jgi:ubiquitin-activating enzyme E1 C
MSATTLNQITSNIRRIIQRRSPFAEQPIQDSAEEILDFLFNQCKILVVGAGGLGCELLKDLALMGVRDIHVIDMDTIELSNLNRQFLFRQHDIGKPKAVVAANFINRMIPTCRVVAHHNRIQDFDAKFYNSFNIIICGLDSIEARRWINNMVVSLLKYDDDGNVDQCTVIPLIDGGTEGLKGNARLVLPGMTACIECNLDLYPPPVNYPICTIANKPRLPEHTIEYVKTLLWPKENPFGTDVQIDEDNPKHIQWIHERSAERAKEFGIDEPSLRFTRDVLKRTIAAVSSTNACIAATCATEAFKLITSCVKPMNNFQILNLSSGIYSYVFEAERNEDCLVCKRPNVIVTTDKKPSEDMGAAK